MSGLLNASATQAGALVSNNRFEVPQFQREYSWEDDQVSEFWSDLRNNLETGEYFLGLVILTEENGIKQVVDGQQRLVTLTLLATALQYEAMALGRKALALRIEADFMKSVNYETDEKEPRVFLSDPDDNKTLQVILNTGEGPADELLDDSVSFRIARSYNFLRSKLKEDLKADPFRRLGKWTEFITDQLYFAVFIHPDAASAYQVFEVVNTRGRELTTADLLKNYLLSQFPNSERAERYEQWRNLAKPFSQDGSNSTFVQFIRHVVTVHSGHVLPKDLFNFLANRRGQSGKTPPSPPELMAMLEERFPIYRQMMDPTSSGPAEPHQLRVFAALNSLNIITVRPILLALHDVDQTHQGLDYLLRLVVRRVVVGNLGTGNIERRFSEAARKVSETGEWNILHRELSDLDHTRDEFIEQLRKRSFNKNILGFMRQSAILHSMTPEPKGVLHFVWPRNAGTWTGFSDEDGYWASTLGNTILAEERTRPKEASINWNGFKEHLLRKAIAEENRPRFERAGDWNVQQIEELGRIMAEQAADVWF
ncbi:DUF262 domain-containing protein [Phaeobacter gallaeciensis]|uniref:DUF262 domain-containing protein n=1 Tax=Phaeobacter gallaeciensis TaxID=60890 RepID=A0ABD4XFG9_9RHOB|nr:DUF262 domain-containing protein [Phaeobacter gallaeciensis]MDE4144837.1 DUF262 domain-containing protein [Phaeobacter gallaeciensis]MDE4159723.1 DUF262 domain-containing protein [Phaeobacter gallaeciensis]MDE4163943.1 DUF262 domain-containing protein [Phaeobacter gallaeciensis]MDE4168175.1 DUF262 domain-containing protein [Phaeobacter gallaeciensis]MDE4169773.1 DUF262 domain-containing protein [Phaeobacter gallaeciensis]